MAKPPKFSPWPQGGPTHKCAHPPCVQEIPTRFLFCTVHWALVPSHVRDALNASYQVGQDEWQHNLLAPRPADDWKALLADAQAAVAAKVAERGKQGLGRQDQWALDQAKLERERAEGMRAEWDLAEAVAGKMGLLLVKAPATKDSPYGGAFLYIARTVDQVPPRHVGQLHFLQWTVHIDVAMQQAKWRKEKATEIPFVRVRKPWTLTQWLQACYEALKVGFDHALPKVPPQ